jgi:hypothetical protein
MSDFGASIYGPHARMAAERGRGLPRLRMDASNDAFPSTDRTALVELLLRDPSARAEAVRTVMDRYVHPLSVYVQGSSLRAVGDHVDLVQGFLADRFGRRDYLDQWAESGLPLRRWLINGLHLYAKEEQRKRRPLGESFVGDFAVERIPSAEAAWARELLAQACEVVSHELSASGHGKAWDVFRRHFIDGRSYSQLQDEFGMRPSALAEASRRVSIHLREAVRILLVRDGVKPADVEAELRQMLQAIEEERP